ncbi:MAG TPA: PQQ-binding-like beta-propeller repeat protein [Planctomycetota bacterium]|nr:PQQ-binding-like beta-propeller repeat protein [Planctomycetota bacterium]
MSDAAKTDPPKAPDAKADAPKPAPPAAKPEEAKPPAPEAPKAAAPVKAAEPAAKPAPVAKPPAPAAAPAAAVKAEPPKPAPVPGKTAAPKPADPSNVIRLELSTKAIVAMFAALLLLILFFGGTTLFLLIKLNDPVYRVTHQPPGLDGPGFAVTHPKAGPAPAGTPTPKPKTEEDGSPAAEEIPADTAVEIEDVKIGEHFEKLDGVAPTSLEGSWPTFRGPRYDNISTGGPPLASRWPEKGPRVLWSHEVGLGYAGAAIHKGRVYLLDYDDQKKAEVLRCFALTDGKEIWRRSHNVKIRRHHGYTRTVPAVTDKHVVTIGPYCHVMCVDAVTGDLKWGINMLKDYKVKLPPWHTAQCPLVDGDTVVLAPAGPDVLIMGVDLETGQVKWKTPNPKGWVMTHSSIIPMTVNGKKTYVYCALGGTFGVSAEKADAGTVLWETQEWLPSYVTGSPIPLDGGHIFLTSGYNAGSMLIRIGPDWKASTVWKLSSTKGLSCEQQTPILYKGLLFSVLPPTAGAFKRQFMAMDPLNGGKTVWTSGKEKRFGSQGLGPFILADDKFYILDDEGFLTMVKASTTGYEELARVRVIEDGREAWGPIAVADGRMIVRDEKKMLCIDVTQGSQ